MSYCFPIEGLRYCGMLLFYRYFHMQVSHSPEGALAEHRIIPLAHTTAYHRATEEHQRLAALPRGDIAAAQLVVATAGWGGGETEKGTNRKINIKILHPFPHQRAATGIPVSGRCGARPGGTAGGEVLGAGAGSAREAAGTAGGRSRDCAQPAAAYLRGEPRCDSSRRGRIRKRGKR